MVDTSLRTGPHATPPRRNSRPGHPAREAAARPYTEQPAELWTASDASSAVAVLAGGGFWTLDMVDGALAQFRNDDVRPSGLLVDLRGVIGYEVGFRTVADAVVRDALRCGVDRIAFVASSAALRLGAAAVARYSEAHVRVFDDDRRARRWFA